MYCRKEIRGLSCSYSGIDLALSKDSTTQDAPASI
jgi:hypothetical protein